MMRGRSARRGEERRRKRRREDQKMRKRFMGWCWLVGGGFEEGQHAGATKPHHRGKRDGGDNVVIGFPRRVVSHAYLATDGGRARGEKEGPPISYTAAPRLSLSSPLTASLWYESAYAAGGSHIVTENRTYLSLSLSLFSLSACALYSVLCARGRVVNLPHQTTLPSSAPAAAFFCFSKSAALEQSLLLA